MQLPAAAATASGSALVMGGLDRADASSSAIVRVAGRRAQAAGNLPAALHDAAAATVGSRTLFMGGGNAGSSSAAIDLVAPGGTTTRIGSLPVGASDVAAAAVDGAVYVVGGYDGAKPLDTIVRVGPGGQARVVAHMPQPLRYAAVTAAGGKSSSPAGPSGRTPPTPSSRSIRPRARSPASHPLPAPTTHAAAVSSGGQVFVLGGRGSDLNSQRSAVVAIDPAKRSHPPRRAPAGGAVGHRPRYRCAVASSWSAAATPAGGSTTRSGPARRRRARIVKTAAPLRSAAVDVYAADRPGLLSAEARRARAYVYVPNSKSNTVDVISQKSGRIVAALRGRRAAAARHAELGPEDALRDQRHGQQPDADRPAHRQAAASRSPSRIRTTSTSPPTAATRSWSRRRTRCSPSATRTR